MYNQILHPVIFLKDRDHEIDIYVYEPCSMLWAAGIKTFYSCQGGPWIGKNGKIKNKPAYIVVNRKDAEKACKVLKRYNAKINNNLLWKRVSIDFDACEAAKNIPLIVQTTKITHKSIPKGEDVE